MIIVTGSVIAMADTFEQLKRASLAHVARSRTEPGCISHAVHIDCENPRRLVFLEQWADKASLEAHFTTSGSQTFMVDVFVLAATHSGVQMYSVQD